MLFSISKWKMENVILLGRGRNHSVSLQSGSFSDQFCESVVRMYEGDKGCLHCEHLLLLNIGMDCGGGRMWCE